VHYLYLYVTIACIILIIIGFFHFDYIRALRVGGRRIKDVYLLIVELPMLTDILENEHFYFDCFLLRRCFLPPIDCYTCIQIYYVDDQSHRSQAKFYIVILIYYRRRQPITYLPTYNLIYAFNKARL
jgi:hypothetical protein